MTALKEVAERFQISVILSARIEKMGFEKNEITFTRLSDLRVSGIIEQLADVILMIFHPVVYEVIQNSHKIVKGEMHIRIAKNKDGRLSLLKFRVDHGAQRYYELEN